MTAYADLTTLKSKSFLDYAGTDNDVFLRVLLETATRGIDNYLGRAFACFEGVMYYNGGGEHLFTDDILSITTLKVDADLDGTFELTYTVNKDFLIYPLNGYPKQWLETSTRADRVYGDFGILGNKKSVEITGVFGYGDGQSATPYTDSGTTNSAAIATVSVGTFTAADPTKLAVGQTIRINSEQMYITGIFNSTVTVKRGVNGTTAATHLISQAIYIYQYPEPITLACLIQTMRWWKRKDSAFQDVVGSEVTGQVNYYKPLDPDVKMLLAPYVNIHG